MSMDKFDSEKATKSEKIIGTEFNKTIIKMTLQYKDEIYKVEDVIMCNLEKEVAIFLYKEGNNSDDTTRARLINKTYGNDTILDLPVGSGEIELISIEIEYKQLCT
ncbi:hypothetical protein [Clostridium sp. C2-6-12]|uniref:hypothetical protein n=1 Tax=Clostridium sp. C2-6-12 TaxID=2698832 RepID=UPI001FAD07CA|nr:hypothetical protein [Clostridium sp. C2-6-12]